MSAPSDRERRQAEALKANLRRRKAQARGLAGAAGGPASGPDAPRAGAPEGSAAGSGGPGRAADSSGGEP